MDELWKTPFECVDPGIGGRIWRLEQPDLAPPLRAELEAHLAACHACRLLVSLDSAARKLVRDGRLEDEEVVPRPRKIRPRRRATPWIAGLALAASIVAVFLVPPRPVLPASEVRGPDPIRFLRPVEGEVLAASRPVLRWTAVAGASRYFVELRDQEGRSVWTGESSVPTLRLPEGISLPRNHAFKAILSVEPSDLMPPGATSVVFRRGSPWDLALHRIRWAHPILQGVSLLALAWLVLLGIRRRLRGSSNSTSDGPPARGRPGARLARRGRAPVTPVEPLPRDARPKACFGRA